MSTILPPKLSYTHLSSSHSLTLSLSSLSLHRLPTRAPIGPFTVRMGGGPRTFPGGVSKWQWKRMQNKKSKQLLKARLMRERQIYEMRKRAELKAAVSELERPWQLVEQAAPNLFSIGADEQVKVLADRFQKPGGFDMWTENDGPQLFETPGGLPTARFFPKGVVHSVRPYGRVDLGEIEGEVGEIGMESGARLNGGLGLGFDGSRNSIGRGSSDEDSDDEEGLYSSDSRVFGGGDDRRGVGGRSGRRGGRFSKAGDGGEVSLRSSNSRGSTGGDRRRIGERGMDRNGGGSRRDGSRNVSGRFSRTGNSDEESSHSSNYMVLSGVDRRQRDMDRNGSSGRNVSGRFSDRNHGGRVIGTGDGYGESSNSSKSRVYSGAGRGQRDERGNDGKWSGGWRDGGWNDSGRVSETRDRFEERSRSSDSRVFSGGSRGQRNNDRKGSGDRRDGDVRKIEDRRGVGSGNANRVMKFPDSRQLASSASEQRNGSRGQFVGYNRSRRDSRVDKGRRFSDPDDVFDMSLQRDGSYSFGSS